MPDLIVLSQSPPNDDSTGTNATELGELDIADVATVIPQGAELPMAFVNKVLALTPKPFEWPPRHVQSILVQPFRPVVNRARPRSKRSDCPEILEASLRS